jgi:tRNA-binding protein
MNQATPASKPGTIAFDDFLKVDIRVGTIVSVRINPKALKPAYVLEIDFGDLGRRRSSAQITQNYDEDALMNRQVLAVVNFPTKLIAGVNSEVLVLAAVCPRRGTVLLAPDSEITNGAKIL